MRPDFLPSLCLGHLSFGFSPAAVRQADFSRGSQAQRTDPRGMTVRYDENGYLKIVLIFRQAGDAEKLSQTAAAIIKLARLAGWA